MVRHDLAIFRRRWSGTSVDIKYLSHDLTQVTRLNGHYHLTKSAAYHCGNGDIMILVCNLTSQHQLLKNSCDLDG